MSGNPLQDNNSGMITEINVTPLVDIILVLLIIFMVTASYIMGPNIPIELPKAANAESQDSETFALVISKDNKVYFNGKEIEAKELTEKIKEGLSKNKDLQAVISADKEVTHGKVVQVIDFIKGLGVTKFAINIEPIFDEPQL